MQQRARKPFMRANMGQQAASVKSRKMAVFTAQMLGPHPKVNHF
jgi:hypothetical protein